MHDALIPSRQSGLGDNQPKASRFPHNDVGGSRNRDSWAELMLPNLDEGT